MEIDYSQKIEILEAILLNKVVDLKWNYYQFNDLKKNKGSNKILLSDYEIDLVDDFEKNIIEKVIYERGEWKYIGEIVSFEVVFVLFYKAIKNYPDLLENVVKRIFDLNKILNNSESEEGFLGELNEKDFKRREDFFFNKLKKGFKRTVNNYTIVAEGDSWFQYPKISFGIDPVKDIIDWLMEEDNLLIKSRAAGGDWLSNMFFKGEYIEEISSVAPDVFLVSGGGNDLVGNGRLGKMVYSPYIEKDHIDNNGLYEELKNIRNLNNLSKENLELYKLGSKFASKEFCQFLNICMLQYYLMFYNLNKKYPKMLIITQGYDYAIPSKERHGFFISLQRALNSFTDNGKWLYAPLNIKGIDKKNDQKAVVFFMIHEFNEMLIDLGKLFGNVFHIDCRGIAKTENDWFDELHLKSEGYEKISKKYLECIRENIRLHKDSTQKVY